MNKIELYYNKLMCTDKIKIIRKYNYNTFIVNMYFKTHQNEIISVCYI